ncbi:MAG: Type 1 glutamine amidotransferase-like domain-containing protein [bacterium]
MKIFLGGGGNAQQSLELDKKFVEALDKTKPVLYIPIAMPPELYSYPSCLEWIRGVFQPLGFDNFAMWTEKDLEGKSEKDFLEFGGVYIGGGNTFKLLKDLKEFGTFEILKSLAFKNIPIYGGSAGAIIFAKTIIPALPYDENKVGLTDFSALNLINGFDMWCHYKPEMLPLVNEFKQKYSLEKIYAIPEEAGLVVSENDIQIVGSVEIV